jgi:mycothiol synthase
LIPGTALLDMLLARTPNELLVWAHGDHPAARALAQSHGLVAIRELLQLRAALEVPGAADAEAGPKAEADTTRATRDADSTPVTADADGGAPALVLTPFRTGVDEDAWVALNARAFAYHPEQGGVTRVDLDELLREDWFDADDFLLLWDGGSLVGYCWLKVERGTGEFYVVGVDPDRQGSGFGRRLTEAGLRRLRERGIRSAHLYVEADNVPAVKLYRSLGFTDDSIDIQYRAPAR